MFGTSLGISNQAGITFADPKLVEAADRLWRPAPGSPALGAAQGDYSFVTSDVDGQDRPALKDAGCDQASAGPVTQRPLTIADVGPAWMPASASADGRCQAAVPNILNRVTSSDACGVTNAITVIQSPAAGTVVGLGSHTITVTATDAAGNSATCTTIFTVTDTAAPGVSCSALSIQAAEYDGRHFTLQWNAVTGMTCQVQSSADLVNWLDAGPPVVGTNSRQRWTDDGSFASPDPPGSPRFYRVKQLP